MLTGEPPFTGATVQQIVTRVRTEEPRSIAAQRKHVTPNIEAAVLTALEKIPADRFESAGAFARALSDPGFRGTSPTRVAQVRARAERRGHRLLVGSLVTLVVVLGAVAAWAWRRVPNDTGSVVRFRIPLPRGLNSTTASATGNLAVSPDGEVVVFAASAADGTRRLYARALDAVAPRALPGTEDASDPFFSPDGRWIGFAARGGLHRVPAAGGLPQLLATIQPIAGATWTTRDVIVFGSPAGLYSLPASGGSPSLVSTPDSAAGEAWRLYPVAMPDGDHVLYSSMGRNGVSIGLASLSTHSAKSLGLRGSSALGVLDGQVIYATRDNTLMAVGLDVATGRLTRAPVTVATDVNVGVVGSAKAALSLSGTLAYRDGGRGSRMVLTNGRDSNEVVLGETRAYGYPRFSPNGKRIAVTIDAGTRSDVWLYDLDTRAELRVSAEGSANERPEWTPDGTWVLYRTDEGTGSSIWSRVADLRAPAFPLLTGGTDAFFEAVVTPDGRSIVYQANNDIEIRPLQNTMNPRIVAAASDFIENQARVSPDGRWLAFVTDESGTEQVVVQPFPGPGTRVQVTSRGGNEPVWSRDGRRLFYRANRKFIAATVATGPTFSVLTRETLFDDKYVSAAAPHANYDVAPDGKRLLVLEAVEEPQIIVVHNWGAEARARLNARAR
jgi:serine/threonine-protein kinase